MKLTTRQTRIIIKYARGVSVLGLSLLISSCVASPTRFCETAELREATARKEICLKTAKTADEVAECQGVGHINCVDPK